jgi:hypothetical protein
MLSARLVRTIEDHAEDLTRGVLRDLQTNPRTPAYHKLSRDELHKRVYDVYHHLGRWVGEKTEEMVEASYGELGRKRRVEGVPLSQVIYALILTKDHLRDYIRSAGLVGSAVELYQEEELNHMIDRFFDRAVYFTVRGYEAAVERPVAAPAS